MLVESTTYGEFPGTWRKHIKDRVHICILLLNFYFQKERVDKVWYLLLTKTKQKKKY